VQYTDVDGECDKLAPDDGHQFTTLTVTVQWPMLTAPETISRPKDMFGGHQHLYGLRDLTTPLSGMVCHPSEHLLPSTYVPVPNLKSLSPLSTKIWNAIQSVKNGAVWG